MTQVPSAIEVKFLKPTSLRPGSANRRCRRHLRDLQRDLRRNRRPDSIGAYWQAGVQLDIVPGIE